MPQIKHITVYQFSELTDEAKENARNWYRNASIHDEYWDATYEDARNVDLKITSFDVDRNRHAKGEFITSAPECAEKIIVEHGEHCETYKTARAYLDALDELGNRPSDENDDADDSKWEDARESMDDEFLKSLLECYSILLQHDYEYAYSNEYVDENIIVNEYEFLETGKRA